MKLPRLRAVILLSALLVLAGLTTLGFAWWRVARCGDACQRDPAALPARKVALVLGCSPTLRDGSKNWFFANRMDAAAALLRSGKVEYLLVSGDNRRRDYDEPTMMKEALIARGVPAERIVCDFAGLTTLDSVIRAQAIFGQAAYTIVSQRFHNERAIYLARAYGIDAIGFDAPGVPLASAPRTYTRETLARLRAVLDAHLFRRQPRHLGDPIAIGTQ